MVIERYEVQGTRLDNGETIKGFYWPYKTVLGDLVHAIVPKGKYLRFEYFDVDPNTVEPVAMKVISPSDPEKWFSGHSCPNCEKPIYIHRKYDLKNPQRCCMNCGQRLDWGEIDG